MASEKHGNYFMEVISVAGSESHVNYNSNIAEVEFHSGTGPADHTYLRFVDVERTATPNEVTVTREGHDTEFRIDISRSSGSGGTGAKEDCTANFTITGKGGKPANFEDFDFLDPGKFNLTTNDPGSQHYEGTGTGAYVGMAFVYKNGKLTVSVDIKQGDTSVDFKIPVKNDGAYEGKETYNITASGVSDYTGSGTYFTGQKSYDENIVDDLGPTTVSIAPPRKWWKAALPISPSA